MDPNATIKMYNSDGSCLIDSKACSPPAGNCSECVIYLDHKQETTWKKLIPTINKQISLGIALLSLGLILGLLMKLYPITRGFGGPAVSFVILGMVFIFWGLIK
jgi:hypothetical protein